MNDNIRAGADHHAGDGGYSIGTKEAYEAAAAARIKSIETNINLMKKEKMNERILELAEQADIEWLLEHHPKLEKFAELIVKECMEWCDAHATINGTAQQIRDSIKKDFGVEE
jgi:hypothetical protein